MIRVGTCSWAEKTLIRSKEFYPKEAKTAEARLRFYALHFDVVEVDSTYYGLPPMQTVALWADRTPPDFLFHIKAYGGLTGHGVDPRSLPPDMQEIIPAGERGGGYVYIKDDPALRAIAERFRENLQPLVVSGKMGVVVFQYPPWFQYSHRNLDSLPKARESMRELPMAVEFRHGSWLIPDRRASVFGFLKEHGMISVTADEPQYGDLRTIPFVPEVTDDVAYFRFHGRNTENWQKKGIETALRYAYAYTDEELKGFIPSIQEASKQTAKTYLMFNNCYMASAIKSALRMKDLIKERETIA